ncbi:MAG: TspO/MBR family protein [Microcystaceae cyanobacterium]
MIPAWLCVGGVAFALAFLLNRLFPQNLRWFNRLRRPVWLTFEWAIPWIWISIFICGAWSATALWYAAPHQTSTWVLLASYIILEILILAYTPVMCRLRSLRVGTAIGAAGFFWGLGIAIFVFPVSPLAFGLLVPYLLWSPIGTYVTWAMIPLNPGEI